MTIAMITDWTILSTRMDDLAGHGDIGISVVSPCGETWSRQGDVAFPSASTAKIPIMIEIHRMLDRQQMAIGDEHVLASDEKSNGSGVLRHLHSGLVLSVADLLYLMISISDNTATNILIKLAGMDRINATMRELGMRTSILGRLMVGRLAIAGEQENLASANDYVRALGAIVDGSAACAAACSAMLATLELQQNKHRIGRYVPAQEGFRWGSKTGTNPGVVNDVGFVTGPTGTMLIAIYCRNVDSEVLGEQLIADATLAAMRATGLFA